MCVCVCVDWDNVCAHGWQRWMEFLNVLILRFFSFYLLLTFCHRFVVWRHISGQASRNKKKKHERSPGPGFTQFYFHSISLCHLCIALWGRLLRMVNTRSWEKWLRRWNQFVKFQYSLQKSHIIRWQSSDTIDDPRYYFFIFNWLNQRDIEYHNYFRYDMQRHLTTRASPKMPRLLHFPSGGHSLLYYSNVTQQSNGIEFELN